MCKQTDDKKKIQKGKERREREKSQRYEFHTPLESLLLSLENPSH